MKKILTDTSVTTARIVLNLEKMVVKEAKRAFTYLSLFGYVTDAVIVNRVLPESLQDQLFRKWQRIQVRYEHEVEESFAPVPILHVPLFDEEVVGEKMLLKMAEATYGDKDPADHFYRGTTQRVEKRGAEYLLSLKIPFVEKSEIDLSRHDSELFLTVGTYRREISLPRVLANRETIGATMEGDELKVRFGKATTR